jgi:uncharacterized membrane protein YjfL (UPF0719 family)
MTPYPILNFIIWAAVVLACLVVGFLVVMWIADELDEERAESFVRGVDVALGRGWDRIGGRV